MKAKKLLFALTLLFVSTFMFGYEWKVQAATTTEETTTEGDAIVESTVTTLELSDLTFKDENGNIVKITQPIQYKYEPNNTQYPNYAIYYGEELLGYTAISDSYYNKLNFEYASYTFNGTTGAYDYYGNTFTMSNAGKYQIIATSTADYKKRIASEYGFVNGVYTTTLIKYDVYRLTTPIVISFEILPKNIAEDDMMLESNEDEDYFTYTGNERYWRISLKAPYTDYWGPAYCTLTPSISFSWEETIDENGNEVWKYVPKDNTTYDYIIQYSNNIMPGMATITMTGVGNYTGTRTYNFTIKASLSDCTFSEVKNYQYTGKKISPAVTASLACVALNTTYQLVKDQDYTVTYENNKKYGEASITLTGMGYYEGTHTIYFGIVPKKVTNIKITSPKALQAKITWKTVAGADGYLIERYNSKLKTYETIGILKNKKWQVFYDGADTLKHNKTYKYRISAFVISKNNSETLYYGKAVTKKGKVTKTYKELNIPILTGNADVDYAAEVICKKVIKKGMSQQQKVKALYNWVVNNCDHDKDYASHKLVYKYSKNKKKAKAYAKKMWEKIYTGKAECTFDGVDYFELQDSYYNATMPYGDMDGYGQFYRAYDCFQTHKGGCSYITRLFKVLVNHVGIECTLIDGAYINRDGSQMYHYWCYIRTNKKYAWYDVDVATSNPGSRYHWYKRNTKFWKTCHAWDEETAGRKIPKELRK